MHPEAEAAARRCIERGRESPYDGRQQASPAHDAALGVLADLTDRRGIKSELGAVDDAVRYDIVQSLTDIIAVATNEEIERLTDRIAGLEAALQPFATAADRSDEADMSDRYGLWGNMTFGDLRRARAALSGAPR